MSDCSFGKNRRLPGAGAYRAVFDRNCFKVSGRHVLILVGINKLGYPRLGLVVTKKNVPLAVQRNRIKRVVRETFRRMQPRLGGIDIVFFARREIDTLPDRVLHALLRESWDKVKGRQLANHGVKPVRPDTGGNRCND